MADLAQPQYEVRFRMPETRPWRADEGRALLGELTKHDPDGAFAPLFHHAPDGSLIPGMPEIRFRGGRGGFSIVGIGDGASRTIQSLEHRVRRLISEHFQQPIRSQSMDTAVALSLDDRTRVYRAHLVVFARKHSAMKTKFEYPDDQLKIYLRSMSIRDIRTQAKALGLELPAERFVFKILDVGRRGRVPLNKAGKRLYVGYVKHLDFLTNLNFAGHWTLGGLQNRGYGTIRAYPRTLPFSKARPKVSGDCYASF